MRRQAKQRRLAFSLVETNIAALLGGLLLMMISGVWTGIGRSIVDSIAQGRVVGEATMALEALRRDVSGGLPEDPSGGLSLGQRIGQLNVAGSELHFCYEGAPENGTADWATPDTVIEYRVSGGKLLRDNIASGVSLVVANGVSQFSVSDVANGVQVELTLEQRDFSRTYTMVIPNP